MYTVYIYYRHTILLYFNLHFCLHIATTMRRPTAVSKDDGHDWQDVDSTTLLKKTVEWSKHKQTHDKHSKHTKNITF